MGMRQIATGQSGKGAQKEIALELVKQTSSEATMTGLDGDESAVDALAEAKVAAEAVALAQFERTQKMERQDSDPEE